MPPSKDGWSWSYGDNMILAERIFSQSASAHYYKMLCRFFGAGNVPTVRWVLIDN